MLFYEQTLVNCISFHSWFHRSYRVCHSISSATTPRTGWSHQDCFMLSLSWHLPCFYTFDKNKRVTKVIQ